LDLAQSPKLCAGRTATLASTDRLNPIAMGAIVPSAQLHTQLEGEHYRHRTSQLVYYTLTHRVGIQVPQRELPKGLCQWQHAAEAASLA